LEIIFKITNAHFLLVCAFGFFLYTFEAGRAVWPHMWTMYNHEVIASVL